MKGLEKDYGVDNVKKQVDAFLPGYLKKNKDIKTGKERANDRYYNGFMEEVDYHGKPKVWNKHIKASETWIKQNTVPCPQCRAPTRREPNLGCNMVSSARCLRRYRNEYSLDAMYMWREILLGVWRIRREPAAQVSVLL